MSGGSHSQGAFGKMLIEPGAGPHTFDASSLAIEFISETMSEHGRTGGLRGIRGTLRREGSRIRNLTSFIYGTITMYLSPNDVDRLADVVWGMTEDPSNTFTMSDSLPYFGMLIDTDYTVSTNQTPFEFVDCMISEMRLMGKAPQFGEQGEPEMVLMQMGIIGSTVTENTSWPSPAPSLPTAAIDAPYIFSDTESGITILGSVRNVQKFLLSINWKTYAKYVNSLTAHSHRPTDRDIRLAFQLPWNSNNQDLYDQAIPGATGSIVFTNGDYGSTFTFGQMHFPNNTPIIRGKQEVPLTLEGFVTGDGSTADLVIVNDIT